MASAAQMFHNDLNIDLIDRPGTDKDLSVVLGQHKAGFHSVNIEQLVGRLGRYDGWAPKPLPIADRKGKEVPVDLRLGDRICFCLIIGCLLAEHLSDSNDVGSAAPQKCRRLKGPYSCLVNKSVCVYDDSSVHRIRFFRVQTDIFSCILDDLRDHFTGRGSKGFHIGKRGALDHVLAGTVVVQNDNGLGMGEKFRALGPRRTVDIHNYNTGIVRDRFQGLSTGKDKILPVFRIIVKQTQDLFDGDRALIDNNVRLLSQSPGDPVDTDSSAEAVRVTHFVTHDENAVPGAYDLLEGLSLDTGLDTGVFLDLTCLAAIIDNIIRRFHDRLITAPAQGQIDRIAGKLIILRIGKPVYAETKAQSDRYFISDTHLFDVFQNVKMSGLKFMQRLFAQNDQELVFLDLAADAVDGADILVDPPVDQRDQQSLSDLLNRLNDLLIVIDIKEADGEALVIHFPDCKPDCRIIHQVQRNNRSADLVSEHHLTAGQIFRLHTPHLGGITVSDQLDGHLDCFIIRRKNIPGQSRNNGRNRALIISVPADRLLKGGVHPQDMTAFIQHCIRHIQLLQQEILKVVEFLRII